MYAVPYEYNMYSMYGMYNMYSSTACTICEVQYVQYVQHVQYARVYPVPCTSYLIPSMYQYASVCIHMHPSRIRVHAYSCILLMYASERQYSTHTFPGEVNNYKMLKAKDWNCGVHRKAGQNPTNIYKIGSKKVNAHICAFGYRDQFYRSCRICLYPHLVLEVVPHYSY